MSSSDQQATAAAPAEPAPEPQNSGGTLSLLPFRGWELALVAFMGTVLYLPGIGSFGLWDPWEGHYAEVARRMLEEQDWLKMRWQNEVFHSKPPLTFWLMALSMQAFGIGNDGGYSGEFLATSSEFAIRLPFALFGIFGLIMLWYMLRRLASRRVAWFSTIILATCPYYFLISRQAITDMPMCAMLIGMVALFALAVFDDANRRLPTWRGISSVHVFLLVFALVVLSQLVYFAFDLQGTRIMVSARKAIPGPTTTIPFFVAFSGLVAWIWGKTTSQRQVRMYYFYLLAGLSVLAKGPVAPGLAGLTILVYLLLTGEWRLLKRVELVRGPLIAATVALPWHIAVYCKDGMAWLNSYVGLHIVNRAFKGAHGDRGTFDYFFSQLGVGMWPWVVFVPVALLVFVKTRRPIDREGRLRLLFGIWATLGFLFFSAITTKFHHYILPAVPALCVLVAFWGDDVLRGNVKRVGLALGVCVALLVITSIDLVPAQEKLARLFIYRYDRTIPKGPPWHIDYGGTLLVFAILFLLAVVLMWKKSLRRYAVYGLGAIAIAFSVFAAHILIPRATPHFGQRQLFEMYYQRRSVHGVDLIYKGRREFARDWGSGKDFRVRCYVPNTLKVGAPMTITFRVPGGEGTLRGTVSKLGQNQFLIAVPDTERAQMAGILDQAQNSKDPVRRRFVSVNADRLIARLYWRGEAFYGGGELYNTRYDDTQTVFNQFNDGDQSKFNAYFADPSRRGKKYWVVAERGRLQAVKGMLPTPRGKQTFREEDDKSSYFFGLASFTL